jgi:predicted SAM-dependent methyltransferase
VIYGGQTDPYDFHKMGFTADSLAQFLRTAGFQKVAQVDEFKLFDDGSQVRLGPTLISLNVIAYKP